MMNSHYWENLISHDYNFTQRNISYSLFLSMLLVVLWCDGYTDGVWIPGIPCILDAYQGFGRCQAWPFISPNLSYMALCPINFWFSLARLRSTRLMDETYKSKRRIYRLWIIIYNDDLLCILMYCTFVK